MLIHNEEYQKIIYRYYAVEIPRSDLNYDKTEQSKNYWEKVEQCSNDMARFDRLKEKVASVLEVNVLELKVGLSYVAEFYLPQRIGPGKLEACVFIISGITNLFSVYLRSEITRLNTLSGIQSQEERDIINQVSELIKEIYPEYEPFPMDLYHTRVPGVAANLRYNDYATYYECLLIDHIY
ncbi:hypothetical protein M1D52_02215 [Olivibacter sp. SA151]|uniref:hypothetical protein n=1 Tax=Olivibacter jilunii TaxID=985016 RepID=UPI003F183BA5